MSGNGTDNIERTGVYANRHVRKAVAESATESENEETLGAPSRERRQSPPSPGSSNPSGGGRPRTDRRQNEVHRPRSRTQQRQRDRSSYTGGIYRPDNMPVVRRAGNSQYNTQWIPRPNPPISHEIPPGSNSYRPAHHLRSIPEDQQGMDKDKQGITENQRIGSQQPRGPVPPPSRPLTRAPTSYGPNSHPNMDHQSRQNWPHHQDQPRQQNQQYQYPWQQNYHGYGDFQAYHPPVNSHSYYQQPFQLQSWQHFDATPDYVPQPPPPPPNLTDPPVLDIKKIRLEAQVEAMEFMKRKAQAADEQKEFQARIRKETEEKVREQFEAMKVEQEEAIAKAEALKREAEKTARERLQAEHRAEADRVRLAAISAQRLEDELRVKIFRERSMERKMREKRAIEDETFERAARGRMLERVEDVADFAKKKILLDLGLDEEAIGRLMEKTSIPGTGTHARRKVDTEFRDDERFGEAKTDLLQSEQTHSMTGARLGHRATARPPPMQQANPRKERERFPGRGMEIPRGGQQSSNFSTSRSQTEDNVPCSGIPPRVPSVPGGSGDSDLETPRNSRANSSYASTDITEGNGQENEFSPPSFEELGELIADALMRRLSEWVFPSIPTPWPPFHYGPPNEDRPFSATYSSACSEITTAQHESIHSIDSNGRRERPIDNARELHPQQRRQEEPSQSNTLVNGSHNSGAQGNEDAFRLRSNSNAERPRTMADGEDWVVFNGRWDKKAQS